MPPLTLNEEELSAVMIAAKPIPAFSRPQFLRDVAAELAKYPELGPGIVGRVVRQLQLRHLKPSDNKQRG